jgi:hypothetical protein
MQPKQNNLLNFENNIKFEEIKKKEDPFNINNLDLDSIVFHEENKVSNNNKSNNEEDKFGLFNNIQSNVNNIENPNSPHKISSTKSDFDLGSLGLDFTNTSNTTNTSNNNGKRNLNKFTKIKMKIIISQKKKNFLSCLFFKLIQILSTILL